MNAISFRASEQTLTMPPRESLTFEDFFDAMRDARKEMDLSADDFLVLLTERPNEENWFARFDEDRNVFVHTAEWEHYVACEAEVAIAYQVVTNIFQRLVFHDMKTTEKFGHELPIGCIDDKCMWKPDMNLKLRTGDVCSDCLDYAEENGASRDVLDQTLEILEELRRKALYSSKRKLHGSEKLPFPVAYARRKLRMTNEPLRKFLCLLDYFDSLVRTTVLTLGKMHHEKNFRSFAEKNRIHDRPALGSWLKALHSLSRKLSDNPMKMSENLAEELREVARIAQNEKIVEMRNERYHGYWGLSDKAYVTDFERSDPSIRNLESLLFPILEEYEYHYVEEASLIDDDKMEVVSKKLMGDHPDFYEEKKKHALNGQSSPFKNKVYALSKKTDRWHNLDDCLVYDNCRTCGHERLLIADGAVHIDTYSGHRSPEPKVEGRGPKRQ